MANDSSKNTCLVEFILPVSPFFSQRRLNFFCKAKLTEKMSASLSRKVWDLPSLKSARKDRVVLN